MIVAHDKKSTKNIFSYYTQLQENYKPFTRGITTFRCPPLKTDARAAGLIAWNQGSYVQVETANNLESGRSFSLRFLHLSEYAFWRNAAAVMGGLMNSVPSDPDTMVIIESTANGDRWRFPFALARGDGSDIGLRLDPVFLRLVGASRIHARAGRSRGVSAIAVEGRERTGR